MTLTELAELAERVAHQVRVQIPRSSNRFLDTDPMATDWLKTEGKIGYTNFLQIIARIKVGDATQENIKLRSRKKVNWFISKTSYASLSVSGLRSAILDFIRTGRVDGKPIDLGYKPSLQDEQSYSKKFGDALADFLNRLGFRHGKERFKGDNVMVLVAREISMSDRAAKLGRDPTFPLKYIGSSATNAFKFGIGNCEECGCAAFSMLLTMTGQSGKSLMGGTGGHRYRMELVYGMSEYSSHYFVLLNRSSAEDIFSSFNLWFDDPTVVVCDAWVTDGGTGGLITSGSKGMIDLRSWLKPPNEEGPQKLHVRAVGYVGESEGLKTDPRFRLPG